MATPASIDMFPCVIIDTRSKEASVHLLRQRTGSARIIARLFAHARIQDYFCQIERYGSQSEETEGNIAHESMSRPSYLFFVSNRTPRLISRDTHRGQINRLPRESNAPTDA